MSPKKAISRAFVVIDQPPASPHLRPLDIWPWPQSRGNIVSLSFAGVTMSTLKSRLRKLFDAFRSGNAAQVVKRWVKWRIRPIKQAVRQKLAPVEWAVRSRVLWGWKILVPKEEFTHCARNAIRTLQRSDQAEPTGDYLEFGVSRGTSLACMFHALASEHASNVRLIGFDSFEGMPAEAATQGWRPGAYRSTIHTTRRYLSKAGVDLTRVQLVKGWFDDTLTSETRRRLDISKASLIMIDCDIYTASRQALWFCEPLIHDQAVIFFDDWGWRSDLEKIGQREAFDEFLAEFPSLSAEPLPAYLPQARVFLVIRLAKERENSGERGTSLLAN
jgi:O-methyltransferase